MFENLKAEMNVLQSKCIGIWNPAPGVISLIIEIDKNTITAISIGKLGGISEEHAPADAYRIVLFPESKTLSEMMNNPIEFHDWWNSNIK
jgi:hypothetical protein